MRGLDWILNAALLGLAVFLLVNRGGSGETADSVDAASLEGRIGRIETRLRSTSAADVTADVDRLAEAVEWLEESLTQARAFVEAAGRRPATGADAPAADPVPEEEIARQALDQAIANVGRALRQLELDPAVEDEVLRMFAEHEMRVVSGRFQGDNDFVILFRDLKSILDPSALATLLEATDMRPEDHGDR